MHLHVEQRDPLAVARWEATYGNAHSSPERRLLLAVLDDALTRYRKALTSDRCDAELAELQVWFACRNAPVPFGFEPICEQLGLDADSIRRQLAQMASHASPPSQTPRDLNDWRRRRAAGAVLSGATTIRRPLIAAPDPQLATGPRLDIAEARSGAAIACT